jgi:hypothetical protein
MSVKSKLWVSTTLMSSKAVFVEPKALTNSRLRFLCFIPRTSNLFDLSTDLRMTHTSCGTKLLYVDVPEDVPRPRFGNAVKQTENDSREIRNICNIWLSDCFVEGFSFAVHLGALSCHNPSHTYSMDWRD